MLSVQVVGGRRQNNVYPEIRKQLLEIEDRLFQQALTLFESILRMGLTRQSPAYNPNLMKNKLSTIQELVGMMEADNPGK